MTTNSWNEGYVTDITYTYGYYRELNPIYLNFCLLLAGYKSPNQNARNLNYCELGFGQGISLNIHAVANGQHLNCYGTDFNSSQTAFAQELAGFNENQNLQCFDDSFADLLAKSDELPNFDYIVLHGIWSWISRENQQHIIDFIAKKLNPGGVIYVSYNSAPGRNYQLPLQKLLNFYDQHLAENEQNTNTLDRIFYALYFAEKIFSSTKNNENLVEKIKEAKFASTTRKHYLHHEYFNDYWHCEYFCDIVEKMELAKMDFACRADLQYLYPDFLLQSNDKAKRSLNRIINQIAKEQILDFFMNTEFRRDIYVKGLRRISKIEQQQNLSNTYFVAKLTKNSTIPLFEELDQKICVNIFNVLFVNENFPKTLQEISDALPNIDIETLRKYLTFLVIMEFVIPCKNPNLISNTEIINAKIYNQKFCKKAFHNFRNGFLASPLTGGAIEVSHLMLILLNKIYENPSKLELNADLLTKFAFDIYQKFHFRHTKNQTSSDGKKIVAVAKNETEHFEFIKQSVNDFLGKELVLLKATLVV